MIHSTWRAFHSNSDLTGADFHNATSMRTAMASLWDLSERFFDIDFDHLTVAKITVLDSVHVR
jgi:hypothetical protein